MKIVPILKIMTVSSVIRVMKNTSPKSGCIQFMVHIFFGTIIVTSFAMILLMTLKGAHNDLDEATSRCLVNKCRVVCTDVDFYKEEELEVGIAASEAALDCTSISLAMIRPMFIDGILPDNWLDRIRAHVRELSIAGGNLNHISPRSFMASFSDNIRILIFDKIKITTWIEDTFLGLSSLRELYIRDCKFDYIKGNALQAIDDTLQVLDIKAVHFWNPINVTGSSNLSQLEKVDFSQNEFYDALNNATFLSLQGCKVLYLNSCKITFIGIGTFDPLKSLEVLYLNNNFLVTIPSGLFDSFLSSGTIRIALHKNFWLCSCTQNDLRTLHARDVIIVEPVCFYPDVKSGFTFSELEEYCNRNKSSSEHADRYKVNKSNPCKSVSINTIVQNSEACNKDNLSFNDYSIISLPIRHICSTNRIKEHVFNQIFYDGRIVVNNSKNWTWLKPLYSSHYMQYSMIEMSVTGEFGSGIVWYQSNNKNEVYCMNVIPDILQLFYTDVEEEYIFCPYDVNSGDIHSDECLSYKLTEFEKESTRSISILKNYLIYMCVAFGCLLCGATCVFLIINRNPTLLRRNKRIVLVKHKTIDALILPPKIPIRKNVLINTSKIDTSNEKDEKIFVLTHNSLMPHSYERTTSMRSSESNDASYISALSPTEEQLLEWRSNGVIKDRISTSDDDMSTFSSLYESLPYYSLQDKVYETIK